MGALESEVAAMAATVQKIVLTEWKIEEWEDSV